MKYKGKYFRRNHFFTFNEFEMSLIQTLVNNYRVRAGLDRFETRIERAGITDTFLRQTNAPGSFITQKFKNTAYGSFARDVQVPVINFKNATVRTTRPVVIPDDENTSAFYTVSWSTIAAGFSMYTGQHQMNEVDRQQDFDAKFKGVMRAVISQAETLGNTALNAAKTQVIATVTGGHTFASNVVSETGIGTLQSSYIFHDLVPMMASNDYDDQVEGMDVVGNQGLRAVVARMEGYGEFNQEDKTLPFGGKMMHWSNKIANAATKNATGYAVGSGSLGMLTRVEPDALMETKMRNGYEWSKLNIPMFGEVGLYEYDEVVDASTATGVTSLTRTGRRAYDVAFDIAHVVAYNSDQAAIASPIIKFDIATA